MGILDDDGTVADLATEEMVPPWKLAIYEWAKVGKVIPVIGNTYINTLLFGDHDKLVSRYAVLQKHAAQGKVRSLSALTQFQIAEASSVATVKRGYLTSLKTLLYGAIEKGKLEVSSDKKKELKKQLPMLTFSELCESVNYPDLIDKPQKKNKHPLRLLADLPLPIFVTTSYHNFLERALTNHGKKPRVEIYNWNERLKYPSVFEQDRKYTPDKDQPLVYHLYGIDSDADSLVLTEDDHLDFMANVAKLLPDRLKSVLMTSSLVVLGYRLHDLDFKVLIRGIIKGHDELAKERVAIQLEESEDDRNYLQQYLQKQVGFEVEWAEDPGDFIKDLFREWRK